MSSSSLWRCIKRSLFLGFNAILLSMLIGGDALADGAAKLRAEIKENAEIEDIDSPLKIRNPQRINIVRNRKTGVLHFIATLAGGGLPFQVFDVNLATGESRLGTSEELRGTHWAQTFPHSNGRFYWDHRGGGRPPGLVEYDPATGEINYCGDFPGPGYANAGWMVEGNEDGKIYAGRVHLNLGRYDPRTGEIEGVGPLGREGDRGYVYSLAVKEPYTYIGTSVYTGIYYLIIYNWETGETVRRFIPTEEEIGSAFLRDVYTDPDGNIYYGGHFMIDGERQRRMYRIHGDEPALVEGPVEGLRNMRSKHGTSDYWTADQAAQLDIELDLSKMTPTVWNEGAMRLRWRVAGDEEWREASAAGVATHPVAIGRLAATSEGDLIGVGAPYNPFFKYNPRSGESDFLGPTTGSIYQIHVDGNRAYFCGYSAVLSIFHLNKPWTYGAGSVAKDEEGRTNPRNIHTGAKWNSHMAIGADGWLYVGGRHGRHRTGGDFIRHDPQTGETESFRKDFEEHLVYDLIAINEGRHMLVSTRPILEGDINGRLFIYDTDANELKYIEAAPGWRDLGNIFDGGQDCYVGIKGATLTAEDGSREAGVRIYKVNIITGEKIYDREERGSVFMGGTRSTERRIYLGPDGCGWLFFELDGQNHLARVHPENGELEMVLPMDERGRIVFLERDIFIYNGITGTMGTTLRRIANVFE